MIRRRATVAVVMACLAIASCSRSQTPQVTVTVEATVTATVTVTPSKVPPPIRTPGASSTRPTRGATPESPSSPRSGLTGCAATGTGIPAHAARRPSIDVDGDGRPDIVWLSPPDGHRIGITTASGATFSIDFGSSSRDSFRGVLVARPTSRGPVLVLADDGSTVQLFTVLGCALRVVTDDYRIPYRFDEGDRLETGTGVGCLGPGNRVGLTGLNATSNDGGHHYMITRTFVIVTGTVAHAGDTDTVHATLPDDQHEVDTAESVTCGTLVLTRDGVTVNLNI